MLEASSLRHTDSCQSCAHTKHGQCSTRLYSIWCEMRKRCHDTDNEYYGGKGVGVCDQWQDFKPFSKWAIENGYNDTLEIHRKDSEQGYNPINCVWLTEQEHCKQPRPKQRNNTSGHTGIYIVGNKFRAYKFEDGAHHLGYFDTLDEALDAQRKVGYVKV